MTSVSPSSKKIIHTLSAAAGAVGAAPIPFADSALILPIQMTMIIKLYKLNGKKLTSGAKKGLLTALTASTIGKGLVGNLFKFFPGIGTVSGGILNASVAVALTEMIGFSIAHALEHDEIDNVSDLLGIVGKAGRLIKR
ncbi:DUF697 domain-containing protein [Vagococcus vulneris]|uniref:GTPase n=1 Tax=Vagococcus vulneris TaxID=1977869 RepID=A0A429ZZ73_9ENTE|nr:DUF697 domain-containing protein [Vagococcus vulneris]RST99280.1 hypothetical protein CBF37_04740 [Vagococcus vulneris]